MVHVSEEKERVANYRPVFVTEITDTLHFYAQDVETGTVRMPLNSIPILCPTTTTNVKSFFEIEPQSSA